jgi:hypothetical protein
VCAEKIKAPNLQTLSCLDPVALTNKGQACAFIIKTEIFCTMKGASLPAQSQFQGSMLFLNFSSIFTIFVAKFFFYQS